MEMSAEDYENSLAHYGILRKSGRYPWGSGQNPNQRSKSFLDIVADHKKAGLSEAEIAKLYHKPPNYPFTVNDLRAAKSHSVTIQKQNEIRQVWKLKDKGLSNSEIARRMSTPEKKYNESTIRSLLEPGRLERLSELQKVADMLKRQIDEKGMIDVGAHVQRDLPIGDNPETRIGISKDKFDTALSMIKEEGYGVTTYKSPQVGTGEMTTYRVALKPERPNMTPRELNRQAWLNRDNLQLISEKRNRDTGEFDDMLFKPPLNIDAKRIKVHYKEDGGADADGMLYVRPGVPDVSLGKSHYAQVRVAVNGTHFLKGMAVYKDDLPPGVDIVFNTNKSKKDVPDKLDAMKPLKKGQDGKVDWTNPFGSFPKPGGQLLNDKKEVSSVMNRLNDEGDWHTWSRNLSRQFLSKQKPEIAKAQLDLTYDRRKQEFAEISALTNPLIKRKLLEAFADETDSSAVYLKAANMPNQATKVLLPVGKMKPHEVYAPGFRDGEKVALVRFPHAGTFEIPELTVNNRNPAARELFDVGKGKSGKHPIDAIGIHPKVAERLSGADFDGDTVVIIPQRGQIQTRPALERLKGFDPQAEYKVPLGPPTKKYPEGTPTITKGRKETEMGKVTNLIGDMTIMGAKDHEIADAVRHSMVVIDSEKHNLDFKASERDHNILALKRRYQGVHDRGQPRGAATLITRATASKPVPKRKDAKAGPGVTRTSTGTIDNKTGKKVYELTGETGANGKPRTFRSKKLAETDDARTLLSDHGGTPIERIYADHSNRLKALANESRRELVRTTPIPRSESAAKVYHVEVAELKSQLNEAQKNAPLERKAQAVANQLVAQRRNANPEMDASEKKKIRGKALEEARARTGANKSRIDITDRQWEAIQAGAISKQRLQDILNNTDVDKLRERATPRQKPVMTTVMSRRAQQMRNSGATYAEIAEALGIPVSTIQSGLEGG